MPGSDWKSSDSQDSQGSSQCRRRGDSCIGGICAQSHTMVLQELREQDHDRHGQIHLDVVPTGTWSQWRDGGGAKKHMTNSSLMCPRSREEHMSVRVCIYLWI